MTKINILAFAGSLRKDSYNKKLVKVAASGAQAAGAEVTFIDLKEYPMSIYDGDLEQANGLPENAIKLKKKMIESDGFLISSPEYNSSISGVLKNTIDWVSRPEANDEPSLVAFKGKVATLMSASPGGLGGLRGLVTVRSILGNIGVIVLPDQIAISKAHEAFNDQGTLKDENLQNSVMKLGQDLVKASIKLRT